MCTKTAPTLLEKYTFALLLLLTVENIKHTRFPGNESTSSKAKWGTDEQMDIKTHAELCNPMSLPFMNNKHAEKWYHKCLKCVQNHDVAHIGQLRLAAFLQWPFTGFHLLDSTEGTSLIAFIYCYNKPTTLNTNSRILLGSSFIYIAAVFNVFQHNELILTVPKFAKDPAVH